MTRRTRLLKSAFFLYPLLPINSSNSGFLPAGSIFPSLAGSTSAVSRNSIYTGSVYNLSNRTGVGLTGSLLGFKTGFLDSLPFPLSGFVAAFSGIKTWISSGIQQSYSCALYSLGLFSCYIEVVTELTQLMMNAVTNLWTLGCILTRCLKTEVKS